MRINKVDGLNKLPWKSEVTEDDTSVPTSVISSLFTEVYEPSFTSSESNSD